MTESDAEYYALRHGVETRVAKHWEELLRAAIGLRRPPRPLGKYTPPEIAVEDGAGVSENVG